MNASLIINCVGRNKVVTSSKAITMKNILKQNYKNLEIWNLGIEIADKTDLILDSFPAKERFGLCLQMSRSSVSIPSNIAEGSSRTNKAFAHYISISLGSSFELETQLILSKRRSYVSEKAFEGLSLEINKFQRRTTVFQKKLNSEI
jgi:four helix bundle protein